MLASFVFAAPVAAQDSGSMKVGNATISVGAGTAILDLPDVPSLLIRAVTLAPQALLETFKASEDFFDEIGWNGTASFDVPVNGTQSLSLNGFWASISNDGSAVCTTSGADRCAIPSLLDPSTVLAGVFDFSSIQTGQLISSSDRDVDHWGVAIQSKWHYGSGIMGVTRPAPRKHFALGLDVRGIYQDYNETITASAFPAVTNYNESLDTTYYGAYLAWGRDYRLPFFSALTSGLGLMSSFELRGGVYYADTEYDGRLNAPPIQFGNSASEAPLSLSRDEFAFIGGLKLKTTKRIGQRTTLSLTSEYEYYSYVPEMAYNQIERFGAINFAPGQDGTVIGDDDAFSARTSLRLTIKLGPDRLFEEPLK